MPVETTDTEYTTVPQVYKKSGVLLNSTMRGFLLALQVKTSGAIVVTSGVRTVPEQAAAMRSKVSRFGVESREDGKGLLDIYRGSLISEVVAGGTDSTTAIQATLERQVARGSFISRHMRADAVDLRTRGLTSDERNQLTTAITALGANWLDESDHIHVEDLPTIAAVADPAAWGALCLVLALWKLS